ncbi:NAD(P)H:quinone oxidoreductase type IV [Jeotgalicoccus huakuii]|nr:NAD(P)H:quinone oxidoreductase type IV [Jeotgalicoccus huakuii]
MNQTKLAVIFYTMTGTNYEMAKWAKEAGEAAGAEVKLLRVEELASQEVIDSNEPWKNTYNTIRDIPVATAEDIDWADALIFSTPTRFGMISSQMKQFIDTLGGLWAQGKTINKAVSAMTSANNANGGQEATLLSFYTTMMHWGAVIVPPGYTSDKIAPAGGNPYGTSATLNEDGSIKEEVRPAVEHQVKRTLEIATKINQ